MKNLIEEEFEPNEIFHNGNIWSFDYKELQVDLITVHPDYFETNLMYLSYNDLGMFIGVLANQFGLKYGQSGLFYPHHFKGSKIAKIHISNNYQKIFEFLGLNFNRWLEGFDDLEDIFEFIAASPYFDWRIFQMNSFNHTNKGRNGKRTSYKKFLDWIDKNAKDREYNFGDKDCYLPKIMEVFPEANLKMEIRRVEYEHCKVLYIKSKFNGHEIIKRFNLKGYELGVAMKKFKNGFIDFNEWVLKYDIETIYRKFGEFIGIENHEPPF